MSEFVFGGLAELSSFDGVDGKAVSGLDEGGNSDLEREGGGQQSYFKRGRTGETSAERNGGVDGDLEADLLEVELLEVLGYHSLEA